ncbi:MAG TPA: BTAD domain-containing putative transcriptional regulator, partial [Chthonomonadaceae bacterium]|nr:BTAD domain-containing putative transcriptional regulator [Chthonomonadaceae bacterium]
MLIQPWEIQLLSALVLRRGEECITHFPTEKAGLLLAHLAAYPLAVHTREDLVERFWPDSDPANGRVSLRQALASLRRMLEPPDVPEGAVLLADRAQVRLNPEAVHTDLALWDRMRALASQASTPSERLHWLEEAIRSYGGDFLPGAYMEWVLTERQHRQEQYQETLLSLIDTQVECGDTEGAIAAAQLLLRTDPLQEEAHERLMRLFASQGKLGLARRQYQKLCRLLRDELNLAPDPKVQALYADLERISRRHAGGGVSAPALDAVQPSSLSAVSLPALPMAPTPEQEALPRLPLRLTRFFGREDELRLLCAWLEDPEVRLMTLTGIGGVGKTRLALQAAQQRTRFGAAITFIPLSDTQDPNLLLPVILQTLGMPAVASSDPLARLGAVLGSEPHLLILDNFEQIAEQAAETVWRLLEQIPSIACLVTSRQALNLPGEYELALAPLPVPDTRLLPQELIANPTVQMLVDRMRARRPDFQVTPANAVAVATLCAHLEGIPLAVELAAGWARDLTISQMQERLAHRFDLLVSRQHGVPPRHQSLRAAVESSYQLLTPSLQRFFLRLSVFRGGWREEMAEVAWETEAGGSEAARAEGLRTLREHSLITVQEVGERVRYGMLETLRAFGQEMLA